MNHHPQMLGVSNKKFVKDSETPQPDFSPLVSEANHQGPAVDKRPPNGRQASRRMSSIERYPSGPRDELEYHRLDEIDCHIDEQHDPRRGPGVNWAFDGGADVSQLLPRDWRSEVQYRPNSGTCAVLTVARARSTGIRRLRPVRSREPKASLWYLLLGFGRWLFTRAFP